MNEFEKLKNIIVCLRAEAFDEAKELIDVAKERKGFKK